jgi:hypothetical protein
MNSSEKIEIKPSPVKAPGVMSDINADVLISKVHGGYFSSLERVNEFIELFMGEIGNQLPEKIEYADFGAGEGLLGQKVTEFLKQLGHEVHAYLIDGNPKYIEICKKTGFSCSLASLENYRADKPLNIISMRAVLHYNQLAEQEDILKNILSNLVGGGFFINQLSSGTEENCRLRTELVANLPLIYGNDGKNYHWTSIDEYFQLAQKAGFSETKLVGCAKPNAWSPEEQWERMNGSLLKKAQEENNHKLLEALSEHRKVYLQKANALIERYIEKYGIEKIGVEKKNGLYIINYQYPVFVSKK